MVYDPVLEGKRLVFGVSGALYKSAAMLYDRQTESLWAQPLRQAVTGPLTGARLAIIPSRRMRLGRWVREHPDTEVLSIDTGYARNYSVNPYLEYQSNEDLMFPVKRSKSECKLAPKAYVLGIESGGSYRAYPIADLKKAGRVRDVLGGRALQVAYDPEGWLAEARRRDARDCDRRILVRLAGVSSGDGLPAHGEKEMIALALLAA